MKSHSIILLLVSSSIVGCSASTKETFHFANAVIAEQDGKTPDLAGISIDAKQRLVWGPKRYIRSFDKNGNHSVTEHRIICAEPSPDALSALSATVSAKASLDIAGRVPVAENTKSPLLKLWKTLASVP